MVPRLHLGLPGLSPDLHDLSPALFFFLPQISRAIPNKQPVTLNSLSEGALLGARPDTWNDSYTWFLPDAFHGCHWDSEMAESMDEEEINAGSGGVKKNQKIGVSNKII